jgi:hypothetical protein
MIITAHLPVQASSAGLEANKAPAGKSLSRPQAGNGSASASSNAAARAARAQRANDSDSIGSLSAQTNLTIESSVVSRQNRIAADSVISDANAAEQLTKLAKQIMLQQPATALLAHSDQLPQRALPLLS